MFCIALTLFVSNVVAQISDQDTSPDENQGLIQSRKLINIGGGKSNLRNSEQEFVAPRHCNFIHTNCDAGGACNIGGGGQTCAEPNKSRCWYSTLNEAQISCNLHGACTGIVLDSNGYEPRRGNSVYSHVAAKQMWTCDRTKPSKGGCMEAVSGAARADEGHGGAAHRGWYDVQGCGRCLDYCRWVGSGDVSSLSPYAVQESGDAWWSCRLAGTTLANTPKGYFSDFNYPKGLGEGSRALQEVCQSGSFMADGNKFFTIGTDGKFWTNGLGNSDYYNVVPQVPQKHPAQNAPGVDLFLSTDSTDAAAHWRFKKDPWYDTWTIVNRLTGLRVSWRSVDGTRPVHSDVVDTTFLLQCRSDHKVFIKSDSYYEARCDGNCDDKSSLFMKYQGAEQAWDVSEVVEFRKSADGTSESDAITSQNLMDDVSNGLALSLEVGTELVSYAVSRFGELSLPVFPIFGSLASFALAEYASGPSIEDQLQVVVDEITAQTDRMINSAIIQSTVRATSARMETRWNGFLTSYRTAKEQDMALSPSTKLKELGDLADKWDVSAHEFEVDMTDYFTDPSTSNGSLSVEFAKEALPFLKIAIGELLMMRQEVLLLDAYAHPDRTCSGLVERYLKPQGNSLAAKYKQKLIDAQDVVIKDRLDKVKHVHTLDGDFVVVDEQPGRVQEKCRETWVAQSGEVVSNLQMAEKSAGPCIVYHRRVKHRTYDFLGNPSEWSVLPGEHFHSYVSMVTLVHQLYEDALKWDMERLSYPIHHQVSMLEKFDVETETLCEKLRSDAEFTKHFEAY